MSNYGRILGVFFFALLFIVPSFAFAIELDAAKQQGLVGETPSGYLAAVTVGNPEVASLVNKINAERKERYLAIAAKNNTPVAAVEGLAGKKAIEMTLPGQFVQSASGEWKRK